MNRSFCTGAVAWIAILVASASPAWSAEGPRSKKPNVVVFLVDDLGYADLGFQGSKDSRTPHLDALAKSGMRCTSGYVSWSVCAPSRGGLLTGRYQQRWGQWTNEFVGLPAAQVTIAEVLRSLGYATGMTGKWHLGAGDQHPVRQGFQETHNLIWVRGGGDGSKTKPVPIKSPPPPAGSDLAIENYGALRHARAASDFITRHKNDPFFLYVSFFEPHGPYKAPQAYLDRFAGVKNENRRTYLAMIAAVDDAIGRVVKTLKDQGLENDTLIFFLSDNGGPLGIGGAESTTSNHPLRGFKGSFWEGGLRVPFLISWPGTIPAGGTYPHPVSSLDILPTALAASGNPGPKNLKLDGVNLLPFLTGKAGKTPHDFLFWGDEKGRGAIRHADWKLHVLDKKAQLYDLSKDIGETSDVAAQHAGVVAQLKAAFKGWQNEVAADRNNLKAADNVPPGFDVLFNGKDLTGWKVQNPNFVVRDGVICFDGKPGGSGPVTERKFGKNTHVIVDWMIPPESKGSAVSGLFFGPLHVRIWNARFARDDQAKEGSGSLGFGDTRVKTLKKADKPQGEWNRFEIINQDGMTTIKLNGEVVIDKTAKAFKAPATLGLHNHGCAICFKNIFIKELVRNTLPEE